MHCVQALSRLQESEAWCEFSNSEVAVFFFLFNNVGVSKNRGTRVGMATKGNHLPV